DSIDSRDTQVGRDLRRSPPVAQDIDIDGDRPRRYRRKKDRVRGDELEVVAAECFVHGPQRRIHRHAAEHVHDFPRVREISVEPTRDVLVGAQHGVGAQVVRGVRHSISLRCAFMEPRLNPLPRDEWDDETRSMLGDANLNIFGTLARHPKLFKRWMVFANHVLGKSTLDARDRELLILRIGWNCRAPYEWGQHVAIARGFGIADDEIVRITKGPDAEGWSEADATLLRAVDELHNDASLSDKTYAALAARYNE